MWWEAVVLALVVLLVLASVGVAVWNARFRKQVYLVRDPSIGADTANTLPNTSPSNLAALNAVASESVFGGATIATHDQLAAHIAAGAEQLQWGWFSAMPVAYVAAMVTQNTSSAAAAQALDCATNANACVADPCLLRIAQPNSASTGTQLCAGDAATTALYSAVYNAQSGAVVNSSNRFVFACGPNAILDYPALASALGTYLYNPPGGVWLYGVKPPQGSDARVQLFNQSSGQYSQFHLYSL